MFNQNIFDVLLTTKKNVDLFSFLTVAIPTVYIYLQGRPYEDGFFCDDTSLSYPYKPDTISTTVLILAGCFTAVAVVS